MKSGNLRVLLIDDDWDCLNVISNSLSLFGYPNRKFTNPKAAIKACKSEKFDVVVADYMMPEMNGIEVLQAVKSHDPNMHVIIMSGYAESSSEKTLKSKGAYAFFTKPLALRELLGVLSRIEEKPRGNDTHKEKK